MGITAVIPARTGSKRIENKNSRAFADSNLLTIKIKQLKQIKEIDKIIVSTDSDVMLKIASDEGVIGKRRPGEYCDEKTKNFRDVVEYIVENEVDTEDVIWTPCVCPLVTNESIIHAIQIYNRIKKGEINADGVVSVSLLKRYIISDKGPVNFDVDKFVTSQNLPDWHTVVNGFYIASKEDMIKWKFVYGSNPYLYELNKTEAIDIDDFFDFQMAENIYKSIKNSY